MWIQNTYPCISLNVRCTKKYLNKTQGYPQLFCSMGQVFNPLNAKLNPICYLLALLAHHFLHVSRIRVKSSSRPTSGAQRLQ